MSEDGYKNEPKRYKYSAPIPVLFIFKNRDKKTNKQL